MNQVDNYNDKISVCRRKPGKHPLQVDIHKATRHGTLPVRCGCRLDCTIWGAHWRHLANMTEPSVCGGDAALRQITLNTCSSCDREAAVTLTFELDPNWFKVNQHTRSHLVQQLLPRHRHRTDCFTSKTTNVVVR